MLRINWPAFGNGCGKHIAISDYQFLSNMIPGKSSLHLVLCIMQKKEHPMFILDIPVDFETTAFKELGQQIKRIRMAKKLKQSDLAAAIDVEKTNLSRIEAGRTNPTLYTLLKISKALNVSVAELVEGISLLDGGSPQ